MNERQKGGTDVGERWLCQPSWLEGVPLDHVLHCWVWVQTCAPGSRAYTGSRPASSPTLTSTSPASLQAPLQPTLRAVRGIPTYHPAPLALLLLGCTHTCFKGGRSPLWYGIPVSLKSSSSGTLNSSETKILQPLKKKKSFENPGFFSSSLWPKLCHIFHPCSNTAGLELPQGNYLPLG